MKFKTVSKIIHYFVLWALLSLASVKLKEIILEQISNSAHFAHSNFLISFYEVHNTGAAFNLFTEKSNILILAAVVFTIIITAVVLAKTSKLTQTMVSAMAMLSAGMMLNTFERIQDGYVTDYIYLPLLKNFPVFNLPDVMIVIGAFVLVFSLAFNSRSTQ